MDFLCSAVVEVLISRESAKWQAARRESREVERPVQTANGITCDIAKWRLAPKEAQWYSQDRLASGLISSPDKWDYNTQVLGLPGRQKIKSDKTAFKEAILCSAPTCVRVLAP